MSIKRQIKKTLESAFIRAMSDTAANELDDALKLLDQLQEPQAVRIAPDLPVAGQAFHYKFKDEWVLAVVVECRVNGLRVQDAFSGGHRPLSIIGEWLPVVPPTFPKEGL